MRGDQAREGATASNFAQATTAVRALANGAGHDGTALTINTTLDALMLFGVSDAHRRKAERYEALQLRPGRTREAALLNDRYNDAGLSALAAARETFGRLAAEPGADAPLESGMADEMLGSFREELADLDLHADEILRIDSYVTELLQSARQGGAIALIRRADAAIVELDEMRRRPDRGGNPWWKGLGFIIGAAAVFTYFTLCRNMPQYCPPWLAMLIALVGLAGAVAALLC
ncbi:MAG: hypothetical protein JXB05_17725 [Myxococcaceae bacterium]|nr:hypothetical protein [Myxococcaceae bacterium]